MSVKRLRRRNRIKPRVPNFPYVEISVFSPSGSKRMFKCGCVIFLNWTDGEKQAWNRKKINSLTSKDFQCSGADTDVPCLVMHLLMSRKMRMITTDTSSTTTITHSHKYFLRRSLVILLKYGNGFKTMSWNYNQTPPVKQKNCDCSAPLVLMIGQ